MIKPTAKASPDRLPAAAEVDACADARQRILEQLCLLVEQSMRNSICAATLRDESSAQLRFVVAPGASRDLIAALKDPASSDLENDYGIAGGWSTPILSSNGTTRASFSVFRLTADEPTAQQEQTLITASNIARIAIELFGTEDTQPAVDVDPTEVSTPKFRDFDSLSILVGSIAHEYNNVLAVIAGNADLAIESGQLQQPVSDWVADIRTAGERASRITRQLQEYAGREISCVETIDLSALIADTAEHLQRMAYGNIEYECEDDDELLYLSGDVLQIRELVKSLVIYIQKSVGDSANAIHLRTGSCVPDRSLLEQSYAGDRLPEGNYVFFEVHHPGLAVSKDEFQRIEYPFFSSGAAGHSLQLATTLGIINRHNGALHVDSDPVTGSKFRVIFPRRILATSPAVSDVVSAAPESGRTVLVVDNEALVVSVAKQMLLDRELHVLTAYDGAQAVSIARQNVGKIDAVVLDATMADMNTVDVFQALRDSCDDLPVIFCSGRREDYCLELVAGKKLTAFVAKPFESTVLYEAVENIIDLRKRHRMGAEDGCGSSDTTSETPSQTSTSQKSPDS